MPHTILLRHETEHTTHRQIDYTEGGLIITDGCFKPIIGFAPQAREFVNFSDAPELRDINVDGRWQWEEVWALNELVYIETPMRVSLPDEQGNGWLSEMVMSVGY